MRMGWAKFAVLLIAFSLVVSCGAGDAGGDQIDPSVDADGVPAFLDPDEH